MTEQELYNEYRKSDCEFFTDFLTNKIAELEKENAELEEKYKELMDSFNIWKDNLERIKKWSDKRHAKAKEIIKDLLEYNKEHWLYSDIKKQAEQFLEEEE
jgi:DNA uptake protein ComE-like DNA-binding protein